MMRIIASVILVAISFLLQTTLVAQLTVGGLTPNLIVIAIAAIGFLNGRRSGLKAGFVVGLLLDVMFGNLIGYYACLYMFVGYINGMFKRLLFPRDITLPIFLIICSDFVYENICYITLFLVKGRFNYLYYFLNVIMPKLIFTAVITCVCYPLIQLIFNKIDFKEREKERENYIA